MNQRFNDVGVVAGNNVYIDKLFNQLQPDPAKPDAINSSQLWQLRQLVDRVILRRQEAGQPGAESVAVWGEIKRVTKVGIDDMTVDHFAPAEQCLKQMLQAVEDEVSRKNMYTRLLRRTSDSPDIRQKMSDFALRRFGKRLIKDLTIEQLREVDEYLESSVAITLPATSEPANAHCTHDCQSCRSATQAHQFAQMEQLKADAKVDLDRANRALSTKAAALIKEKVSEAVTQSAGLWQSRLNEAKSEHAAAINQAKAQSTADWRSRLVEQSGKFEHTKRRYQVGCMVCFMIGFMIAAWLF
ncbi:hypothetical protein [Jeongeupia chitinilytica]|uniref:KfrA N-terminal DNA-binding domain-containing protein n=1 Tax=Jeongeupia chitinilytica TaxID=1041641 RepID=A0ABQ3GXB8_9NEIS|nr:hypothetical protein [Jeongeupia chitinilytica]GHD59820.1 hypothetical protein GCM10007350_11650 [Jeongeupia chitinilytica]